MMLGRGGKIGDEKKSIHHNHEKSPSTTSQSTTVTTTAFDTQPLQTFFSSVLPANVSYRALSCSSGKHVQQTSHLTLNQNHSSTDQFQQSSHSQAHGVLQQSSQSQVQSNQLHHGVQSPQQQQSSQSQVQSNQPHHPLQPFQQQEQNVLPQSNYTFLLQQIQLHQSQGHQKNILKYLLNMHEHIMYVQREMNYLGQRERYLSLFSKYHNEQALTKAILFSNRTTLDRELLEKRVKLQTHLQSLQEESQNLQRQSQLLHEQTTDLPPDKMLSSMRRYLLQLNHWHSEIYNFKYQIPQLGQVVSQYKNLCQQQEMLYEVGLLVRKQQFTARKPTIPHHIQPLQSQPQQSIPSRDCNKRPFGHHQTRQPTHSASIPTNQKRQKLLTPANKIPQKIHPTRKSHLVSQQDQQPSCSWQQSKDQERCDEVVQRASFSDDMNRTHQLHPPRISTSAFSGTKQRHRELEQDLKPSCSWQQPQQSCEMNLSRFRISSNSTSDSDVQGSTMEALTLSLQRKDRERSRQVIQPGSSSDSVLEDINRPQQQHPSQTTTTSTTTPRRRQESDPDIVISCSLQQSPYSRERNIACFLVSSNSASPSKPDDFRVSATESLNSSRPMQDQEGRDEVFQPGSLSGSLRRDASRQ